MNQRIRELLVEAKEQTKEGKWHAPTSVWAEKFAELIVRECAGLVPAEQSHAPDGRPLLKIFEEHFGVADVDR